MVDIVHEVQDTHLCALFIGAHGDGEDCEYALDAANSAAKHLQAIQAELPAGVAANSYVLLIFIIAGGLVLTMVYCS